MESEYKYNTISLSSKVAYMFFVNRCQLSRHTNWVEKVIIIFIRNGYLALLALIVCAK